MSKQVIDHLIISSPYSEPTHHWSYLRETQEFEKQKGRRPAGYWRTTGVGRRDTDDLGEFVPIELVNKIRPRVKQWREKGYPNITGTTSKLLKHWQSQEVREMPFFWCQLEAVETAIWLTEADPSEHQGIDIPGDNGWERQCLKLATGTGKTVVMAMIIAWQALNKIASPQDKRFSKNILIISPGITVRDRLRVLRPEHEENFYNQFHVVPPAMWQELLQAKIIVENWHTLMPLNENSGPKVVKKGPESDEAFIRRVLPDFGSAQNILIINDEAHHCHRPTPDDDESGEEQEKATIWVSGIDRIHKVRGVLRAYDLTATPFKPSGRANQSEKLFQWIVSDFGLNDAIESGLVKTPKVAVRDDSSVGKDFKSKLFHIYQHVKDDLNRRAEEHEGLPDLLRNALNILGADWLKMKEDWQKAKVSVPPVLIVIGNRAETADRIEYAIKQGHTAIKELESKDGLLVIHQSALDKLENEDDESMQKSKKDLAVDERERFNSVGKEGKPGEKVQCVIGVNMLSEGWDARTVTHILGVRAFTSQLLCEQVIGRGLRRLSYDLNSETGMFDPEYVTVFGVPFTYLPVEQQSGTTKPEVPKTKIQPLEDRKIFEISWPHLLRVEYKLSYLLDLDWDKLNTLTLSPQDAPTVVEVAPVIDGKPDYNKINEVDLKRLAESNRLQSMKLRAAALLHKKFEGTWPGDPGSHVSQIVDILDQFITSRKLQLKIPMFENTELLGQVVLALNMQKITDHIAGFIRSSSNEEPMAVFDSVRPVRSTASAPTWYTSKPVLPTKKSQISHIVMDSRWEALASEFDRNRIPGLISWAKNDHLGLEIYYFWQGETHIYYPDFIIKFEGNRHLILEVKGKEDDKTKAKHLAAEEWIRAVNAYGNLGKWEFKVLRDPKNIFEVVK